MAGSDREILTQRIRESVDIVDIIGGYVTLRRAGAGFKGLCPFHEEKTPSFTVHPARQTFKCFGCGVGGDVFTFLQRKENVDFLEARRMLAERAGVSLEGEERQRSDGPGKSDLVAVNEWAQGIFRRQLTGPEGESVRAYVVERGISEESAENFGLGLALDRFDGLLEEARKARIDQKLLLAAGLIKSNPRGRVYDTFRHRLMFPIRNATGRIIAFGGRALGDDPAKYLNTPATALFDKSANLFGLDIARQAAPKAGRIVVVEGYTDCIMAHQAGFTETVATLGTAMTDSHAGLLRRYTDRLILLFDSDEAGQNAADRAVSVVLTSGLDVTLTRVPEGKDPCDYILSAGKEAFASVLNAGVGALEFKWRQVARSFGSGESGPERRRAMEAYLQELATWVSSGVIDPIQRGLLVNQLSKVLSMPADELHRQLGRMAKRARGGPVSASQVPVTGGDGRMDSGRMQPSVEQVAWQQIVEVLLNEPDYYASLAGRLRPEGIENPALAAVAGKLVDVLDSGKPFRLDGFIGGFESVDMAGLITDLQAAGERRGQYAAVIEGALDCLESCARSRQVANLADEIRDLRKTGGEKLTERIPTGENERLLALAANARHPHFAPSRVRKKFFQG